MIARPAFPEKIIDKVIRFLEKPPLVIFKWF